MSLDLELVSHLLSGTPEQLKDFTLNERLYNRMAGDVIDYAKEYCSKHKKIPSPDTIFKEKGIRLPPPQGDYEYTVQQLYERGFHQNTKTLLAKYSRLLSNKQYEELEKQAKLFPQEILSMSLSDKDVEDLFARDRNELVWSQYQDRKMGVYGVITPWPTLNEMTWGWQPGDFALVGARPGSGKTWFMLHMAHHAWKEGKKVLFITPEMNRTSIMNRYASIHLKLSYENIRKGQLSSEQEITYKNFIMDFKGDFRGKFFIFSDEFEMYIENLNDAVMKIKPDIIFVDGIYLLKSKKERDRMKVAPIIADESKQMAKRHGIPFIASTQLNKDAIKIKVREITQGHFVLSDAFAWNTDWAFCIGRDEKERENRQMVLRPLKAREGDYNKEIMLNWDFLAHNFSEFKRDESGINSDIPF